MSGDGTFRYRAFISYSHRDADWAAWLHRALESHRIAPDLVGKTTTAGPVPKSLRPIFRDRDDFAAGHSLTAQTQAALEASECLIVLCSPRAAASAYVNEEIRIFKRLGRAERIIPLIVDGAPEPGPDDCFPPALHDGAESGEPHEPIAADARPQGDGKERAKLKVIAALLGVRLDEIVRRADNARRRQKRVWGAIAGVLLFLALAASASAAYAWHQLQTNRAFLNSTLASATEIVDTAVLQAQRYNVPTVATLELLKRAERLFAEMARLGQSTPELRYRKAAMLIAFARNYAILGDTGSQRERITEALAILQALVAEHPGRIAFEADLAVAHSELGNVLQAQGRITEALRHYEACLQIMQNLRAGDPQNPAWRRDIAASQTLVASIFITQGRLSDALALLQDSLHYRRELAAQFPQDMPTLMRLSASHSMLCLVLRVQRRLDEALAQCRESLALRQRVATANPENLQAQAELANSHDQVGSVHVARGEFTEALASGRAALAVWERLAGRDPTNMTWQSSLAAAYDGVSQIHGKLGQTTDALESARKCLALMQRLVSNDPRNALWRRDLAVAHGRLGALLSDAGRTAEALEQYRQALGAFEAQAASDPANSLWQHDLFVAYAKLGQAYAAQGHADEATRHYRLGLVIIERLTAADPTNKEWFVDLVEMQLTLARQDDDATRRLIFVVKALHGLQAQAALLPEHAGWLREAEAALQARGATAQLASGGD
ncbi:MAG: toll/interleukin-1 receptor domain-containing protein [Variibacter sp.]|nr:toll/interleukin-1 receptor domain-containing protein [Variibacter sp.]